MRSRSTAFKTLRSSSRTRIGLRETIILFGPASVACLRKRSLIDRLLDCCSADAESVHYPTTACPYLLFLKPISYTELMVARLGWLLWALLICACGPSKIARRSAMRTSSVKNSTPSFFIASWRCALTVRSVLPSSYAICLLSYPARRVRNLILTRC